MLSVAMQDAVYGVAGTGTSDVDAYILAPVDGAVLATDSAAAGTAIATGVKTSPGNICWKVGDPVGGQIQTIAEKLRSEQGFAIGVVSTAGFSDATPAAMVSHNVDRGNLTQIAQEIIYSTRPEVVIGGGYPTDGNFGYLSPTQYNALLSGSTGYTYVGRSPGVDGGASLLATASTVDPNLGQRLFGLFGTSGGDFEFSRASDTPGRPSVTRGSTENPSLAQATEAALEVLSRDPQGFFVMIEEGVIDHANHSHDFGHLVSSVCDLDQAVSVATSIIDRPGDDLDWSNTLVIVTADHANGYLRLAQDMGLGNLPEQQPPGGANYPNGEVSYRANGHTNELVTLQARGAGASLFATKAGSWYPGTQIVDNTQIYQVMCEAVAAGTRHVVLFIGDGMQLECEIAASRYRYGQDFALAWHSWGAAPDGWAGYASTWDVRTFDRHTDQTGGAYYDPAKPTLPGDSSANNPTQGYDPELGGVAPFPLPGSNSIGISCSAVNQHQPAGSLVGSLSTTDSNPAGPHEYSLVSGPGSDENALFKIVGDRLFTNAVLDLQTTPTCRVRVRSTDQSGNACEKQLLITVTRSPLAVSLDVDGNGSADALTDGILILRYLFDPKGDWGFSDALGSGATRTTLPEIKSFLDWAAVNVLDADGNGTADALSDGILMLRYLFDRTGEWSCRDALGTAATKTTRDAIQARLDPFNPEQYAPAAIVEPSAAAALPTAAAPVWDEDSVASTSAAAPTVEVPVPVATAQTVVATSPSGAIADQQAQPAAVAGSHDAAIQEWTALSNQPAEQLLPIDLAGISRFPGTAGEPEDLFGDDDDGPILPLDA